MISNHVNALVYTIQMCLHELSHFIIPPIVIRLTKYKVGCDINRYNKKILLD